MFSGVYVTYISEGVKEKLRSFHGQAIQIEAIKVFQSGNPGDALIKELSIIGLAPASTRDWYTVEGTRLQSTAIAEDGRVAVTLTITNDTSAPGKIETREIGFALIGAKPQNATALGGWGPSDGPSTALITRSHLLAPESVGSQLVNGHSVTFVATIAESDRMPERFTLPSGGSRSTKIVFDLPPGDYQFLAGYGGGVHESKLVFSNPVSFSVGLCGKKVF